MRCVPLRPCATERSRWRKGRCVDSQKGIHASQYTKLRDMVELLGFYKDLGQARYFEAGTVTSLEKLVRFGHVFDFQTLGIEIQLLTWITVRNNT